jgi:hypothetical protein
VPPVPRTWGPGIAQPCTVQSLTPHPSFPCSLGPLVPQSLSFCQALNRPRARIRLTLTLSFSVTYLPLHFSPNFADHFASLAHNSLMIEEQTSEADGPSATGHWLLATGCALSLPSRSLALRPRSAVHGPRLPVLPFSCSLAPLLPRSLALPTTDHRSLTTGFPPVLTTNHYTLITAFHAFPTTNQYPRITAFTHPPAFLPHPHPSSPHPLLFCFPFPCSLGPFFPAFNPPPHSFWTPTPHAVL